MYFALGCELGPSEAQAQNTSKNDDLGNSPIFLFDFCVETDSGHPQRAGMCSVYVDNFFELALAVRVMCLWMIIGPVIYLPNFFFV